MSIFEAIEARSLSLLSELAKDGSSIRDRDKYGRTPLMFALQSWDDIDAVRLLLDAGADALATDEDGEGTFTPLHYAAKYASDPKIIELLIERGADVNAQVYDEDPDPLITAIESGQGHSVIQELVRAGANVNSFVRNIFSDIEATPLMIACQECNDPEVISLLMESGARTDVFDEDGNSPYLVAMQNPELRRSAVLKQLRATSLTRAQVQMIQSIKRAFERSSGPRFTESQSLSILCVSKSENFIRQQLASYSQTYGYGLVELSTELFMQSRSAVIERLRGIKDKCKVLYIACRSTEDANSYLSPFDDLFLSGSFGAVSNAPETTFGLDPIIVVNIQSDGSAIDQLDNHMTSRFWRIVTD